MKNNTHTIFIDVREPSEFAFGHVKGAINIPVSQLMQGGMPQGVSTDANIVVYCRSGSRANSAQAILKRFGYENVTNGINRETIRAQYGV